MTFGIKRYIVSIDKTGWINMERKQTYNPKKDFIFEDFYEAWDFKHKLINWNKNNKIKGTELTPNQLIKRKLEIGV